MIAVSHHDVKNTTYMRKGSGSALRTRSQHLQTSSSPGPTNGGGGGGGDSFPSCMTFIARHSLALLICTAMVVMSVVTARTLIDNNSQQQFPNYDGQTLASSSSSSSSSGGSALRSSIDDHPQGSYRLHPNAKMTPERLALLRGPKGPKPVVLVTGAAGFVGMHTCLELKKLGMTAIGYDNVNDYYSTDLKELRIQQLQQQDIPFIRGDVCDGTLMQQTIDQYDITRIIHLAAQAGVRYSLDHPFEYTRNNVECVVQVMELVVKNQLHRDGTPLIYASSSSVYGNNLKIPFAETDPIEDTASVYAATKRSNEILAQAYRNLYNMTSIGLRFFTVYGPYGRPDMAPFLFTDRVSNNQTIKVFNHGQSRRDFTYVDDIVSGVVNSLFVKTNQPEVINLGFGRPIVLQDFVNLIEQHVGRKAITQEVGMQKGDVPTTYADISKAQYLLGYQPSIPIEEGIAKFVTWFRQANAGQYRMGGQGGDNNNKATTKVTLTKNPTTDTATTMATLSVIEDGKH